MKTTELDHEILLDLLPVYLAGDASPATRALVEQRMETDPRFAELVRTAEKVRLPAPAPQATDSEMKAFLRTRRRLLLHHLLLALAVLFTLLFAVSMGFLLDTFPQAGAISFLLGAICWSSFWLAGRSLR